MNVPINPNFIKCLETINESLKKTIPILAKINIEQFYKLDKIEFIQDGNLFYYIPQIKPQSYVAAFDIDWTLTYTENKLFPHTTSPDDIHLLPNRKEELLMLFKKGYSIVLFTNQLVSPAKRKDRIQRITNLLEKLGVPCYVFIATGKDHYRKPNIGMWQKFNEFLPIPIEYSFYVGDALGRPQDFSNSDKEFANNIGIPYYSPESFFPQDNIEFPLSKTMVITVGMPGSGKSSYIDQNLVPLGYHHLSRDKIGGNKNKFISIINKTVLLGVNLVIDATNPKLSDRETYYEIANQFGYDIIVLYFVRNGFEWNKLRKKQVPAVVYHTYFKNLEAPQKDEYNFIILYKIYY